MRDRIKQLEELSRSLDPNAQERGQWLRKVIQYTDSFLGQLKAVPVYRSNPDAGPGLFSAPVSEGPMEMDQVIRLIRDNVDAAGVNVGSGGWLAYIPGSGLYASALADYIAAITNRYAGIYFASPGAVAMDRLLLTWVAEWIGYPKESAGDMTSGGSISNLIGMVTARDAHGLKAKDFSKAVVYLSQQTHHSVDKALRIAGLGEAIKRQVPLDECYRMNPAALEREILRDKKAGLSPWLLIPSAGTTDTGAVDPLTAMAEIALAHKLWLHVDGAYGAAFMLCAEGRKILQGIERSDSLVMDPHKGLFIPFGSGMVLVRDGKKFLKSFYYEAAYLQDSDILASPDEVSPCDLSPELTRHFRALRLWLPLKLIGLAPFRAALEEKMLLARYFHERMQEIDRFWVGPYPDLSIVVFRYVPKQGDADEFNQRLIKAVQEDGRVFISSTLIEGKFTLRMAALNFRTHLDRMDLLIQVLREKVKEIEKE